MIRAAGDFRRGAGYVGRGLRLFYGNSSLWKFALLPLVFIFVLYTAASVLVFGLVLPDLLGAVGRIELPSWLSWSAWLMQIVLGLVSVACFLLVIWITFGMLYEAFGALVFDSLTAAFEKQRFGYSSGGTPWRKQLKFLLQSIFFSLKVLVLGVVLFALSLFIPVAGQVLMYVVMGYYLGMSFLQGSAANHGIGAAELPRMVSARPLVVLGFGVTASLLMLVPLVFVFLTPGLVIGGSLIFREELRPDPGISNT